MIVNCQKCSASYQIDDSLLGEDGRKVKCVKCGNVWIQTLLAFNNAKPKKPKVKAKGLDWVVTESSIKEEKLSKEIKTSSNNGFNPAFDAKIEDFIDDPEINLDFIKEEPEVYVIPELPEDNIALIINKNKQILRKNIAIVLSFFLLNALWFGRFVIVEKIPPARILYDLLHIRSVKIGEGLIFKNIARKAVYEDEDLFLEVRGYVANISLKTQFVHNLEFQLYDENGKFLKKSLLEPDYLSLSPNFTMPFVVKIENPPKETAYIITTFSERS